MRKDTLSKYLKFKQRLARCIADGRFARYTYQKRNMLIRRLNRLRRQVERLQLNWKLAAASGTMMASMALASPAHAQDGPEFRVNTETNLDQSLPSIATDADGDFVIAWASEDQDGNEQGVYAQRYNAAGVAQDGAFLVNTETDGAQTSPSVAMDEDGDFVIAWQSNGQDGSGTGIYAQRYNAAGVAQDDEFLVNTETDNNQYSPSVAMDDAGNFVITWTSTNQDGDRGGIYAQRYNAAGDAQGGEFRVNTQTSGNQRLPSIAMDVDGDFAIIWLEGSYYENYSIYTQRYNSSGNPQDTPLLIKRAREAQSAPKIGMDADGNFVVVYNNNSNASNALDPSQGVYAQRYDAMGVLQGSEFLVNTEVNNLQWIPSVAMEDDGEFVITWQSKDQDGSGDGVYAQRYRASGRKNGEEFRVNTETIGSQNMPMIAMDDHRGFVVVWESDSQDGSGVGVYAQRYSAPSTTPTAPVLSVIADQSIGECLKLAVQAEATDVNDDELTYSLDAASVQLGMEIDPLSGLLSWGATQGQAGDHVVTVTVNDGSFTDQQEFTIEVTKVLFAGSEFQVNTDTPESQQNAVAGTNANGDFVIAWESDDDTNINKVNYNVYFQRYDNLGVAQGNESQANFSSLSNQENVAIAMNADGSFVLTWQSENQDNSLLGIFARQFDASGTALSSKEFQVNTETADNQFNPSIGAASNGGFVIAWQSEDQDGDGFGIYAQRFDATGSAQGTEFLVNTTTSGSQSHPVLAMNNDGSFIIVWQSGDTEEDIYAQRYDASGVAQGGEFQVNGTTTGRQTSPSIAMNANGDFVITWESDGQDGDEGGIYARRYDGMGSAQGVEFRVNTETTGDQGKPSISMADDGSFAIVWESMSPDGSQLDIYGQRYEASGTAVGGEFRINTEARDDQSSPFINMRSIDDLLVVWHSYEQDGSFNGVYAKQLSPSNAPVLMAIDDQMTKDEATLTFTVVAFDADGDDLMFDLDEASKALGMSINVTTGEFSWTPTNTQQPGEFSVTVTVSDGKLSDSQTFTIQYSLSSAPVLAAISDQTITEESTLTFTATATDADGDALTFDLDEASKALGMSINATTGAFSWTPNNTQSGEYPVTVTVSDGELSDSETFNVIVSDQTIPDDDMVTGLDQSASDDLLMYPNPVVSGSVTVSTEKGRLLHYEVMDLSGQLIRSATLSGNAFVLEVSNLSEGQYVVKINSAEGTFIKRFVKKNE